MKGPVARIASLPLVPTENEAEITEALNLLARFWSKVDVRGPEECWRWKSTTSENGYGTFSLGGRKVRATHVSLILSGRYRPDGLMALHSCDNPICVNPRHLSWGTHEQNMLEKMERDRCSRHGTGGSRGEGHRSAKLTREDVLEIRSSPLGYKSLARRFGVSRESVRSVKRGQTWAHVSHSPEHDPANPEGIA